MDPFANNISAIPQRSSYTIFAIVVFVLVVLAGISLLFTPWPWSYDAIRSWWTHVGESGIAEDRVRDKARDKAKDSVRDKAQDQVRHAVAAPGAAVSERTPVKHQKESWCFVGEDLTGRYCVQVPSEKSCDTDRVFLTRKDCELTPANHMAAGIIKENGESMLPLAKMRFG